ncbi:sulfotransferase family protein [Salipiger thiooxidans]|uniref:sulfotransferase family protein n=1 Tax=Salipiger thiooxidans TaxID=282683 RepID=UPI001CFB979B|nr:sulfotransferase [Salipiger thiooxidans]
MACPSNLTLLKSRFANARKLAFERVAALGSNPHERPVFVFGNQKSGTSAISVLMGHATGARTQMDFRGAWEPFLTPLIAGETDLDRFIQRNAYAFSAPIVKEPGLTFVANRLAARFPDSPCVFIVRDPFQNIRSILNRLKLPGTIDAQSPELARVPNATWRAVVRGTDLNLSGEPIEVQAQRWMRAVAEYQAQPGRFILVRYEDFVADKEGVIADLARQVGLEPRHSIAATKDKAFQSRGRPDTDLRAFFGEKNFDVIARICGSVSRSFGYEAPAA